MKGFRKAITSGLVIITSLLGCSEPAYKPVSLSNLPSPNIWSNGPHCKIEGLPSLIREEEFILTEGDTLSVVVQRGDTVGFQLATGPYPAAREALEKEAKDGDREPVKVYGYPEKDKVFKARYIEVEDTLYPVYR